MKPSDDCRRTALVVRGGWEGHVPVEATDLFIPGLERDGYRVTVADSLEVYTDAALLAATDLVLQCWTMGTIASPQIRGLCDAVAAGTGFAGWHGGIVDSFRSSPEYLQLTGGQFVAHPGGFVDYEVVVAADRTDHEIVAGIQRFGVRSEQYWVLADSAIDVLATTTIPASEETPWRQDIPVPAVWTRQWGQGRVFVTTLGHQRDVKDLEVTEVRRIVERGMRWATR